MNDPQPIHRIFGLLWMDFFAGTSFLVETEIDLSIKQQFLDLVIIRVGAEPVPRPLPDGFEPLAARNLITFKSHQEALDVWALHELIGHYVNYRKQSSPSLDQLLPPDDFRLFAVCSRFPENLAKRVALSPVADGVYDVVGYDLSIRVIVASRLARCPRNAMLHLYSAKSETVLFGQSNYEPRSPEMSTIINRLLKVYVAEGIMSSEQLKDFVRQAREEFIADASPEERLKGLPPEERLKGLPPEERLKGIPAEERLKGLPIDDVLKALTPEMREALRQRLQSNGATHE